jgi:hypothetical protein
MDLASLGALLSVARQSFYQRLPDATANDYYQHARVYRPQHHPLV